MKAGHLRVDVGRVNLLALGTDGRHDGGVPLVAEDALDSHLLTFETFSPPGLLTVGLLMNGLLVLVATWSMGMCKCRSRHHSENLQKREAGTKKITRLFLRRNASNNTVGGSVAGINLPVTKNT
jgi:hypothetical protein